MTNKEELQGLAGFIFALGFILLLVDLIVLPLLGVTSFQIPVISNIITFLTIPTLAGFVAFIKGLLPLIMTVSGAVGLATASD